MNRAGETPVELTVDPRRVFTDLQAATPEEVFREMGRRLAETGVIRDPEELARRLLERERLGSTGLGSGIAIPHLKLSGVSDVIVAIAVSPKGIDFRAPDGVAANLIFLVLSPADSPALHLQTLARISRLLRTPGVADNLRTAQTPERIAHTLKEAQTALTAVRT